MRATIWLAGAISGLVWWGSVAIVVHLSAYLNHRLLRRVLG